MKFKVNENCIGCGLCANTCPDVFSMTEEGIAVAVEEDVAASVEDSAKDALTSCPAEAIEEI